MPPRRRTTGIPPAAGILLPCLTGKRTMRLLARRIKPRSKSPPISPWEAPSFTSTAPAYTISLDSGRSLQLYDSGMSNSSIFAPTFVANDSTIAFHNSSSVANVALTLNASSPGLASVTFDAGTSAFSALITANGGACTFACGTLDFATVLLRGGTSTNPMGGDGDLDGANGASARVYSGAAAVESAEGGIVFLHNGATAGNGLFSSDGSFFPEQEPLVW